MGADASSTYPTEPPTKPDESGSFRAPDFANVCEPLRQGKYPGLDDVNTMFDLFEWGYKLKPDLPLYGKRVYENGKWQNRFVWINRREFREMRDRVGAFLVKQGCKEGDHIGIMSYNRIEWVVTQHACYAYGFIPIPVYDTYGLESMKYIIDHAQLKYMFVVSSKFEKLSKLNSDVITDIIIFDAEEKPYDEESFKPLVDNLEHAKIHLWKDLLATTETYPYNPPTYDTPATINYTSGTTGNPKGCILTHGNFLATASSFYTFVYPFSEKDSLLSFLPLAHSYEGTLHYVCMRSFTPIAFYSGSPNRIIEEVGILKPTIICSVPRIYERVMDGMSKKLAKQPFYKRALFHTAFSIKSFFSEKFHIQHIPGLDLVFKPLNAALGGNMKLVISGGAPLSQQIQNFIRVGCNVSFVQGYGLTETTSGTLVQCGTDTLNGNVGVPIYCVECKFRDIPDMGYMSKDYQGELLTRGKSVFKGYYHDEEKTREIFEEDGWIKTGDIFELTPTGQFKVIGRVKELVKLPQGEYISLGKLTAAYSAVKYVNQIYVYAGLQSRFLVAIVVLDPTQPGYDKVTKEDMIKLLDEKADQMHFNGYEKVKNVYLTTEAFTTENGLLAPNLKLVNIKIEKRYQKELQELTKSD